MNGGVPAKSGTPSGTNPEVAGDRAANLDWVWERSGAAYTMRFNRRRWEDIEVYTLSRPILIVLGTWLVLAWARFGSHAISSPRALTRFVLVGVYAWIGLTVLLWLVARFTGDRADALESDSSPDRSPGQLSLNSTIDDFASLLIKVGQAHQPLGVGGLIIQIIQILPTGPVLTIIAYVSIIWMGGQLVGAMAAYQRRPVASVAIPTLLAWLPWLATAGWYLWHRLSHVI